MVVPQSVARWYRNRFVWVTVILLATSTGVAALVNSAASEVEPADLQGQMLTWMRATLEQADPETHNHTAPDGQQVAAREGPEQTVICGVHVYGHEPTEVTAFADVRTIYGFHLCGVAGPDRPWDVAPKLAGPLIIDRSTDPPGIQVVEGGGDVMFVDRLREMFPTRYAALAMTEALSESEMADLRRRYDAAAGL
ncbi:hypothetical protein [Micromonospora sp. LOL_023]|uniref:hypothetical protein n=1 Tax=Micromonospora sp. LOL_023 TaxID=3345418 RepID=UPI003A8B09B4